LLSISLPIETGLLDAPVLGSLREAESGSLKIFVGGPARLAERVTPLLRALGSAVHVGELGSGAAAKLVANATLFGTLGALGEAIALARGLGLSDEATYQVLAATPLAGQAERRRGAIETSDYPPRFPLSLARKDADLITEAAAAAGSTCGSPPRLERGLPMLSRPAGRPDYTAMLATILRQQRSLAASPVTAPGHAARRDHGASRVRRADRRSDGVVWLSGEPIDGAAEAIAMLRANGTRVLFLTNEPQLEAACRTAHCHRHPGHAADVMTSAAATAHVLGSLKGLSSGTGSGLARAPR
jgi:hypothetical protein